MTSQFSGRRAVVAGVAVSGIAAAEALLDREASVLVVDARAGDREQEVAERLRSRGAEVRLGDAETPVDADVIVTSPGWRPDQPLLVAALAAGVEVIGEPELAARLERELAGADPSQRAVWLGVTGTNGKTTTVGMLESILRAAGLRTVAAGNVGLPLVTAVLERPSYDVLAVELSSFQLHWSSTLRFHASTVLNIAPDHLDWHGSMEAYVADKVKIWDEGACALYNDEDEWSAKAGSVRHDSHSFGTRPGPQFSVVDGWIEQRVIGPEPRLAPVDAVRLPGPHNLSNAVAASGLAYLLNTRVDGPEIAAGAIAAGLSNYQPGAHRNALVAERDGVQWVDDSKATNPHAAAASLAAYPSVVWVAGGLFKGANVDDLVASHAQRLRGVVVIGTDRAPLVAALLRHAANVPVVEVTDRDTETMGGVMPAAVAAARQMASAGDTVLLAPAAASMDQFRDYADRGDRFTAAVRDGVAPE